MATTSSRDGWTFLSNHAHVLVCLSRDPFARMREMADRVGITERAIQRIVADLEASGVLTSTKEGRRKRYAINLAVPLRHPLEANGTVGELLDFL